MIRNAITLLNCLFHYLEETVGLFFKSFSHHRQNRHHYRRCRPHYHHFQTHRHHSHCQMGGYRLILLPPHLLLLHHLDCRQL